MNNIKKKDIRIDQSNGMWYIVCNLKELYLHKDRTWNYSCGEENFHKTKESAQGLVNSLFNVRIQKELALQRIEKAKKELTEAKLEFEKLKNEVKVGQKYKHNDGDLYVLARFAAAVKELYFLVCYHSNNGYTGTIYSGPKDNIDDVFGACEEYFTLIGEETHE